MHSTVKEANVDDFMNLVNDPAYPSDQRLLRLKEVPLECTEKDVRRYFNGLYRCSCIFSQNLFEYLLLLFGRSIDFKGALDA